MRFRAAAGGRGMTHGQYLTALVELDAADPRGGGRGDEARAVLDEWAPDRRRRAVLRLDVERLSNRIRNRQSSSPCGARRSHVARSCRSARLMSPVGLELVRGRRWRACGMPVPARRHLRAGIADDVALGTVAVAMVDEARSGAS